MDSQSRRRAALEEYFERRAVSAALHGPRFFPRHPRWAADAVELAWLGESPWPASKRGARLLVRASFEGPFAITCRPDDRAGPPAVRAVAAKRPPYGGDLGCWAPDWIGMRRERVLLPWTRWRLRRQLDALLEAAPPAESTIDLDIIDGATWILEASDGARTIRLRRHAGAARDQARAAAQVARLLVRAAGPGPWSWWKPTLRT